VYTTFRITNDEELQMKKERIYKINNRSQKRSKNGTEYFLITSSRDILFSHGRSKIDVTNSNNI
jgi:hypothetical protein